MGARQSNSNHQRTESESLVAWCSSGSETNKIRMGDLKTKQDYAAFDGAQFNQKSILLPSVSI